MIRRQRRLVQNINKSRILGMYLLPMRFKPGQMYFTAECDNNTAQQHGSHVLHHLAGLALAGLCLAGLGLAIFSLLMLFTSSPASEALRFFESAGLDFV